MSLPKTTPGDRAASPVFDALLAAAKRTPPEALIDAEELDRRRPLTPEEIATADADVERLLREDDTAPAAPVMQNGKAAGPATRTRSSTP
jgi:hypothetical protein